MASDELVSSSAAAATASADSPAERTVCRTLAAARFSDSAIWPTSSLEWTDTWTVRSPSAMASRPSRTARTGAGDGASDEERDGDGEGQAGHEQGEHERAGGRTRPLRQR